MAGAGLQTRFCDPAPSHGTISHMQQKRPLGELIREQRKIAHLSLRELAKLARVSNAYLSQVERGVHEPSLRVLNAVADALDVPLESMVATGDPASRADANPTSVEDAIRMDNHLGSDAKSALLTIYRSLVMQRATDDVAEG